MAFTVVKAYGTFQLTAGNSGTLTSAAVPSNVVEYILWIQQMDGASPGGWVHDGSPALRVDSLAVSYDGGTTWNPLVVNETLLNEALPAAPLIGRPADTFSIASSLSPQVGATARLLRFSYTVLESVHVSPTILSIP